MFPNNGYYLYNGNYYWTLSPAYFSSSNASVRYVYSDGSAYYRDVGSNYGVRPVINLKPNSLKFGDGTALDPYRVE